VISNFGSVRAVVRAHQAPSTVFARMAMMAWGLVGVVLMSLFAFFMILLACPLPRAARGRIQARQAADTKTGLRPLV
jgi:hypothetical protein